MQVIRHTGDDHLDGGLIEQFAIVRERGRNSEAFGEGLGVAGRGRGHSGEVRVRTVFQRFRVNRGNKLRADEADVHGCFHGG